MERTQIHILHIFTRQKFLDLTYAHVVIQINIMDVAHCVRSELMETELANFRALIAF